MNNPQVVVVNPQTANPPIVNGPQNNNNKLRQRPLLSRKQFLEQHLREPPLTELARLPKDEICIFCYDELRNHVGGRVVELPCGHMFGKGELMQFLSAVDETRCFNNRCPKCLRVLHKKASPQGGAVGGVPVAPDGALLVHVMPVQNVPLGPVVPQMPQDWAGRMQRSVRRKALAYQGLAKKLDEIILAISVCWLLTTIWMTLNRIAFPPALSSSTFTMPIWDLLIMNYTCHRLAYTAKNKCTEAIDFLRPLLIGVTWAHFILSTYQPTTTSNTSLKLDATISLITLAVRTHSQITTQNPIGPHSGTNHLIALAQNNRRPLGDFQNHVLDHMFTGAMLDLINRVLFVVISWMGWSRFHAACFFLVTIVDNVFVRENVRRGQKYLFDTLIPGMFTGFFYCEVGFRMWLA